MAAKVQSNDFSIFMRKIGYSVGLENTLERLKDFARIYAEKDSLSVGDLKRLLHNPKPEGWGLEPQNEHILDFFRAIDVCFLNGGDVGVLELGEALGIAKKLLSEANFELAARFYLTHALIRADGDIFLNALASEFEPKEFSANVFRLVEHKWTVLESVFRTNQQRAAIYRAVTIEVQENNPGSRGKHISRFGPLISAPERRQLGPLAGEFGRPDIRISENYIEKTLGRRRFWAISLGLCEEGGALSPTGRRLLRSLADAGYAGPTCMATWPLAHELETPLFSTLTLPSSVPLLSSWEFMLLVGRGLNLFGERNREGGDKEISNIISVIREFHSLNKSRSIVRNEVSIRVAYRCLLGLSIGMQEVPDYPALIKKEQSLDSPRVIARPSRLVELALSISR